VIRGSSEAPAAPQNFPHATLKEYDSFEDELAAVPKGEILALLDNDIIISRYLKMPPSAAVNLDMHVFKDLADFIGIAVRPDSPHLLAWINVYLFTKGLHFTTSEFLAKFSQATPTGAATRQGLKR
jgi:polar amino acid transport system substrate-binding protein